MPIRQYASSTKSVIRQVLFGIGSSLLLCTPALCQAPTSTQAMTTLPPVAHTADLSGPRFGFTFLPEALVQTLAERDIQVGPNMSQFGWQFEKVFYTQGS